MMKNLAGMSSSPYGSVNIDPPRSTTKGLNNLSLHDRYMKGAHSMGLILYSEIRHIFAEAVDIDCASLHLVIETFLAPYLYDLNHARENYIFFKARIVPKVGGNEDSALTVEGAIDGAGHEETLKGPYFFSQQRLMAHLLLEDTPFVIRKDHQVIVPVCDHQPAVVCLGENFPQLGRKDDPALGIYRMMILTPEDGHERLPSTISHFTPLGLTIRRENLFVKKKITLFFYQFDILRPPCYERRGWMRSCENHRYWKRSTGN